MPPDLQEGNIAPTDTALEAKANEDKTKAKNLDTFFMINLLFNIKYVYCIIMFI